MELDRNKFSQDESRSNPMVVAIIHADCPEKRVCFFVAMGRRTGVCEHFQDKGESANCDTKK